MVRRPLAGEIGQTFRSWTDRVERFLRPHYSRVAIGLEGGHLLAVRLGRKGKGKDVVLERWARNPLPVDSWKVSFTRPNLQSPGDLRPLFADILERIGPVGGTISILLPDSVARVSLLEFPELPIRRKEILPILRFRLQKTIPFRMEEAILGFDSLGRTPNGKVQLIAVLLHRNVLRQYEELFRALGIQPGLVDLSSLNLLNFCRSPIGPEVPPGQDWLLVNFTEDFLTLLVLHGEEILFYRSKGWASQNRSNGNSCAWALRELRGSLSYYVERLGGGGIQRCFLRATAPVAEDFRSGLEAIAGVRVEGLDPMPHLQLDPETELPDPVSVQKFLPLIGMAMGRRE